MIDRAGRNRLAARIHQRAAGVLTNYEFEEHADFRSHEDAIQAVFWSGAWLLYDDFQQYRLRRRYRLGPRIRTEAGRWVLFLKTDLAYEWPLPRVGLLSALTSLFANLLTLGLVARRPNEGSSVVATSPCGPSFAAPTIEAA